MAERWLRVRGARTHNLRDVDVDLPHDRLVVVTGVSGSGKSSLVHDTVVAEAERLWLQGVSSWARRFVGRAERPPVEELLGLRAAVAVRQGRVRGQARSTVGTLSEVWDCLRVLYARAGRARCHACGVPLERRSAEGLAADLARRFAGREVVLLARAVEGHRGARAPELARLAAAGVAEVSLDGSIVPLAAAAGLLADGGRHDLDAVVCRRALGARPSSSSLLLSDVSRCLRLGRGVMKVVLPGGAVERFAVDHACPACGAGGAELGPRLFSFNGSSGACPACRGLGVVDRVDPDLLVADPARTVRQGSLVPTLPNGYIMYSQVTLDVMDRILKAHGGSVDVPWRELTDEQRRAVLFGTDRLTVPYGKHPLENRLRWTGITARPRQEGVYRGIVPVIEEILRRSRTDRILRFVRSGPCQDCAGTRLRPEARAVSLGGCGIAELGTMALSRLRGHLEGLALSAPREASAAPARDEAVARLRVLEQLGLGHLALERESTTLSGGEAQRVALAGQVLGGLSSVLYVLDEPSAGLHPLEQARLLEVLRGLRDEGSTVLLVEHDPATWRAADWLVDVGPGAAGAGGMIQFSGSPAALAATEAPSKAASASPTRAALLRAPARRLRLPRAGSGDLLLSAVRLRNLQGFDVRFKLGAFNVVTGPSGAGKTTLVRDVLAPAARAGSVRAVVEVDQAPLGRTPRSNAATYTGLADVVRDLFAREPSARERGFAKGRFSFNVAGGRCEACEGAGVAVTGMLFLDDVALPCEACGGRRFNDETLAVRWRGRSIGEVLELSVAEALEPFGDVPAARRILAALDELGLGYLRLGQPCTTLSGGEAQRVKLAAELARPARGGALYVLDEPTSGLHPADVAVFLGAVDRLVSAGNTVVAVEHDPDVVAAADWVVALGPGGGPEGGRLLTEGPPASASEPPAGPSSPLAGSPVEPADPTLEGVRTNNLQGVDVRFPRGRLTVVTGPSGSGKSSLVFDTLHAESQRRFVASLSTQARRTLGQLPRPALDGARGLGPSVAVGQAGPRPGPRSTVATLAEVHDLLRLAWSRAGEARCPGCGALRSGPQCTACGRPGPWPLTAGGLSFNKAEGACPRCTGLGVTLALDPARLVSRPELPLLDGAMDGTKTGRYYGERDGRFVAQLAEVSKSLGLGLERPWAEVPEAARGVALRGSGDRRWSVTWRFRRGGRTGEHRLEGPWEGLATLIERDWERLHDDPRGDELRPLMAELPCPDCRGVRLGPDARAVRLAGLGLAEVAAKTVDQALAWLPALEGAGLAPAARALTAAPRAELARRLGLLAEAGLGYLTLDRPAATLSGGEARRLRLALQVAAGLEGLTCVLDEPTAGLHPEDTGRLLGVLGRLCAAGATVVVVEHDLEVVRAADHVLELGPGGGAAGGRVVVQGSPSDVARSLEAPTARWLRGQAQLPAPRSRRALREGLTVRGAAANNLRGEDVRFPGGGLLAVTGVSGSGKSSLVFDVLAATAAAGRPVGCAGVEGLERYAGVHVLERAGGASAASSFPLLLVGLFDGLRALFAASEGARARRFGVRRFALGARGGRCEACAGTGQVRVDLDFLGDAWAPCEECGGARFDDDTLACTLKGRSIADVLAMSVDEAVVFLEGAEGPGAALRGGLAGLAAVGLGYLRLGQPGSTLSGGESQRLRLASFLGEPGSGERLFLLDEPTTGLHLDDVEFLASGLQALAGQGHTVVLVEHHMDLVACADWVLDLGFGAGPDGGRLVAEGPPEAVAGAGTPTGRALARALGRRRAPQAAEGGCRCDKI